MRLRHNMVWMLLGNSSFAAFQWLYLISIARFAGAESAGAYALCLAFIYPSFALFNLQLARLQITDREKKITFSSYAFFALLSGLIAIAIAFLLFHYVRDPIGTMSAMFLILASAKLVETLSDVCYGALQHDEQMRPVAISMGMRGAFAFAAFFMLLLKDVEIEKCLLMLPICWAAVFVLYDVRKVQWNSRFKLGDALTAGPIVQILTIGAPLGALFFFNQLYIIVPRISLESMQGLAALGYFAPLASLITLGALCTGAANSAALPRLSKFHADTNTERFMECLLQSVGFARRQVH